MLIAHKAGFDDRCTVRSIYGKHNKLNTDSLHPARMEEALMEINKNIMFNIHSMGNEIVQSRLKKVHFSQLMSDVPALMHT